MSAAGASGAALAAGAGVTIDWGALGAVAGVSFLFGLTIIVVFSLGIVGMSWLHAPAAAKASSAGGAGAHDVGRPAQPGRRLAGAVMAAVCFALCLCAALFGLWLLIPQFH